MTEQGTLIVKLIRALVTHTQNDTEREEAAILLQSKVDNWVKHSIQTHKLNARSKKE